MVVLAKTIYRYKSFCACCSAANTAKEVAGWDQSNGWLFFPYETRGVPPFILFGWRWHVWKLFPGLRCFPFAISFPPLWRGGSDFSTITDLWSRLIDEMMTTMSTMAHWRVDLRGLWERFYRIPCFRVQLSSCQGLLPSQGLHVCLDSRDP